jgi:hypothetical protein
MICAVAFAYQFNKRKPGGLRYKNYCVILAGMICAVAFAYQFNKRKPGGLR